uniref:Reverse transcriptase domain-containing protein n=1 Tax=Amphimedon queenslandica TaxID=400682 RepID=A0A1X7SS29_AMPQE
MAASSKCCACNGPNAVCKGCSCVKNESPCSSCLPGRSGSCHNGGNVLPDHSRSASPTPCGLSPVVPSLPAASSLPGPLSLPSLDDICHLRVPVLFHVPKGARNSWSGVLSSAIEMVIARPLDMEVWTKLFMLPKCILFLPPFRQRRTEKDLVDIVNERLLDWRSGDYLSLWAQVSSRASAASSSTSSTPSNVRRARRATESGLYQKAIQALSSRGLVTPSQESRDALLLKHPQCPPPSLPNPSHLSVHSSSSPLSSPRPSVPPPPSSSPPCPPPPSSPSSLSTPPSPSLPPCPSVPPSSSSPCPFPSSSSPPSLSSPPPSLPLFLPASVLSSIKSFPTDTAPGPSGLRASHLKEAVCCPSPSRAQATLLQLSHLINFLSSGACPPPIVPYLCGATLLASPKKSGGLRPIAIGEVIRRLVSKCLASFIMPQVRQSLPPHQLGVGVSNGAESLVHSLKLLLSNPSVPPLSQCCLLLDFSNAFNSIDRSALFREVRSRFPSLSPWLECCYGAQPNLLFGEYTLLSCAGVQQGDPLGPLAFSILLHPIIERVQQEVPGLLLNAWYLDDGILTGPPADLLSALNIIEDMGPPCGLHLNHSKSLLFLPSGVDSSQSSLPSDIPVTSLGFVLLGSPIGPPEFCCESISKRLDKAKESVKLL